MQPGPVVVDIDQRAFNRTGGQEHALGADTPYALTRATLGAKRHVVGAVLQKANEVVIVITERGGVFQHRDVGVCQQFFFDLGNPLQGPVCLR